MKEAIGNAFLFNIVIVFVVIFIAFLVGSLSYTKAFKVKNRIVSIIEENETYNNSSVRDEIDGALGTIGYRVNKNGIQKCDVRNEKNAVNKTSNYRYCIYEYQTSRGKYYGVVAYMYFDIPLISEVLEIPIYGETKIIYDL